MGRISYSRRIQPPELTLLEGMAALMIPGTARSGKAAAGNHQWSKELTMKSLFSRFVKDESGATAIEYGLIAAIVGIGIIAALTNLRANLGNTVGTNLSTVSR
jgi:pilus assembly protein Flp/PilA